MDREDIRSIAELRRESASGTGLAYGVLGGRLITRILLYLPSVA